MALIEKIGDVTKYTAGGQYLYFFPACNVSVNLDVIDFKFYNLQRQRIEYTQITDVFGTTTAEGYVDYLATNGYFSIPTGSGGTQDVDIVADSVGLNKEVTQALVLAELESIEAKDSSNSVNQVNINAALNAVVSELQDIKFLLTQISE